MSPSLPRSSALSTSSDLASLVAATIKDRTMLCMQKEITELRSIAKNQLLLLQIVGRNDNDSGSGSNIVSSSKGAAVPSRSVYFERSLLDCYHLENEDDDTFIVDTTTRQNYNNNSRIHDIGTVKEQQQQRITTLQDVMKIPIDDIFGGLQIVLNGNIVQRFPIPNRSDSNNYNTFIGSFFGVYSESSYIHGEAPQNCIRFAFHKLQKVGHNSASLNSNSSDDNTEAIRSVCAVLKNISKDDYAYLKKNEPLTATEFYKRFNDNVTNNKYVHVYGLIFQKSMIQGTLWSLNLMKNQNY